MTLFRLVTATLLPGILSACFFVVNQKTAFAHLKESTKQWIYGISFGVVAILATEFGINVDGAILNVRTAAPLTAGLLFGAPAGIISGLIGGIERWFSVYWSGGEYTRVACTVATILAGVFSAILRKQMFEDKPTNWMTGFVVGLTVEVLHMLLVFVTNMSDIHTAFAVVEQCAPPMILLNACATALALLVVQILSHTPKVAKGQREITEIYRSALMTSISLAFLVTCLFTTILELRIAEENTSATLELAIQDVLEDSFETKEDITRRRIGQSGFFIVADLDGTILQDQEGRVGESLASLGIDPSSQLSDTVFSTSIALRPYQVMIHPVEDQNTMIVALLPESEAMFARNTSVYMLVFMEILVFAALFVSVYFLTKRVVVDNIQKINGSLEKITNGDLEEKVDVHGSKEFDYLTNDINSTVATLKDYIEQAKTRIDTELRYARDIQHSALPSVFPPYPNHKDFDIYASLEPAREVGGDFYDFFLLSHNRFAFLVADVSGKGIPAAMFMMTAKSVIKGLVETGAPIEEVFSQANQSLCEGNHTGMFVTAWLGILNLKTGVLEYVNAGHNPPLIRQENGNYQYLRTRHNFILAGKKNISYTKQQVQLEPGDAIFLYTDGVTEARNADQEMFREDRLLETINQFREETAENQCKKVLQLLANFSSGTEQFDDITVLSMKLKAIGTKQQIQVQPNAISVDAVNQFVEDRIQAEQLPKKTAYKIKICTDEIYANIRFYSQATKLFLSCRMEEGKFVMCFKDNGIPYDPTKAKQPDLISSAQDRDIGGLGIHIVKKSVSSLTYSYVDGWNTLELVFDGNPVKA